MTSTRIKAFRGAAVALIGAAVLVASGCGGSDETTGVTVSDPWARSTADGQTMGAAYMTITGGSEDDRLVAASAPTDIAAETQIHETVAAEDGTDTSMSTSENDMDRGTETDMEMGTSTDAMTMREVEGIDVPADGTVTLEPGGYHVMLMDLAAPLTAGETFDLTLTFEEAGEQVVTVEVRDA
jgi:copper(I)-binding protein